MWSSTGSIGTCLNPPSDGLLNAQIQNWNRSAATGPDELLQVVPFPNGQDPTRAGVSFPNSYRLYGW